MTAEQAREAAKGLTFEDVWAALLKTDERIEEMSKRADERSKRADERIAEMSKRADERSKRADERIEKMSKRVDETSEVVAKTSKEVDKTSKEVAKLTKNLGGIGNSLGKMTEAMFSSELWKKFSVHGFKFTQGSSIKFSAGSQVLAEVDFFMENGDYAMPVEIKTELSVEDVDEHLKRMDKIRRYMDGRQDKRKLVGAVAGAIVAPNVVKYAQRQGFFVLVQTGDSIAIARAPKGFAPKEW
jgi:DNA repair exonuclease SbcCD ATPase subunit